jgi:hypothetical protein
VNEDAFRRKLVLDRLTSFDLAIIICIVLLAVGIILRTRLTQNRPMSEATQAAVYLDGKLYQSLSLHENREISLLDGKMLLEIKNDKLRVKKSDCPRQVCVNIGWIQHMGEAIICVPFKASVEIRSAEAPALDAVVF